MNDAMTVQVGGGFRGPGVYPPWMSDGLVMRLEEADRQERAADHALASTMSMIDGDPHTRALLASGELAKQRGEYFTHREVMRGEAGRTKAEALAYHSALMDQQDAQLVARQRRQLGVTGDGPDATRALSDAYSADVSAPHPEEVATRAKLSRWRSGRHREDQLDRRIITMASAAVTVHPAIVAEQARGNRVTRTARSVAAGFRVR